MAVAPQASLVSLVEDVPWTILPARPREQQEASEDDLAHSLIRLPVRSPVTQPFLKVLETIDRSYHAVQTQKLIEVRTLPIQPLALDTIVVTVEKDLLENVDEIQNRFGGGFRDFGTKGKYPQSKTIGTTNGVPNGLSNGGAADQEARLKRIVREGLSKLPLIQSGNVFPLPLPSHPITHVAPPPAIVAACEPVMQGSLSANTRVVLVKAGSSQGKALKQLKPSRRFIPDVVEEDTEDTSNEAFYSATEDRQNGDTSDGVEGSSGDDLEGRDSAQSTSDDASDDSLDDMLQLSAPSFTPAQSDTPSAMTAATSRPEGRRATGTQTPGSIYSTFTSTTTRAGSISGKLFKTEVLLHKIPSDALHPRPADEDDDESFVFVDISTLAKIGCFSGDWARLESTRKQEFDDIAAFGFSGPNPLDQESDEWRAVRVFGLPGLSRSRPRYAVDKSGDRRSSFSQMSYHTLTPVVQIPPLLLNNIGDSGLVRLAALSKSSDATKPRNARYQQDHKMTFSPPAAKEVTLLKISTPLATSRDLQSALFAGLKRHFESKKRLLQQGDLIGIAVDEELAKLTCGSTQTTDPVPAFEDLTERLTNMTQGRSGKVGIAWFAVDQLSVRSDAGLDHDGEQDRWEGTALVDATSTRMAQAGSIIRTAPEVAERNLKYWLGLKRVPRRKSPLPFSPISTSELSGPSTSALEKRLSDLVSAATSSRAIKLGLPPSVILLHSTQRQTGKSFTALAACSFAGIHVFPISAHDIVLEGSSSTGGGDIKAEGLLKARAERALTCGARYTALLIQHIDVLTSDRMFPALQEIIADARVVLATTTQIEKIPDSVRNLFTHELELNAPNETERENILCNACLDQSLRLAPEVDLGSVALKTAALVAGDLVDVVSRASLARSMRLEKLATAQSVSVSDVLVSGGPSTTDILAEDFSTAISHARSTFSDSIGAPKIPSVKWEDVGGLADQKSSIMETISLPLSRPELFANGMRKRSGILFYGPPGTGKTLLAKAIATEFSLNFFSVKGPELLNMYIGESEANVRRVFQRARDARPCVVFFDELDSVAPKRGNQGDSGGVMDRIVSQLLAELDGMSSGGGASEDSSGSGAGGNAGGVFVIGATNRPDLLDPALLRPGRFDQMLYLGVSSTHDQQVTILEALTRKFSLAPDVDLRRVVEKLPFTYTGADLYALCSDAMLKAITRKTRLVDEKVEEASRNRGEEISTAYFFDHLATPHDVEVVVNEEDFVAAQKELVASVRYALCSCYLVCLKQPLTDPTPNSAKELAHFERIRNQFEQQDLSRSPSATTRHVPPAQQQPTGPFQPPNQPLPMRQPPPNRTYAAPLSLPSRIPAPRFVQKKSADFLGKGKAKARGIANPDSGPDSGDDEDDYVVRTDHPNHGGVNGTKANGNGRSKGKIDGFMDAEEEEEEGEEEDLYG